jgi:DNA-binding transcriptional LysR family regulator
MLKVERWTSDVHIPPVSTVNVHHLELFYYVARHGGITEAVRRMPYGIQQPAVSAQILQLERMLGVKLFQRRPFSLTAAGAKLYAFIQPFFGELSRVAAELRGQASHFIRIGASGPVLRHHVPQALRQIRKAMPQLALNLYEAYEAQLVDMLRKDEIDLAITVLHESAPAGLNSQLLLSVQPALVVPKSSRLRSAQELWDRDTIDEPLISLPAHDGIAANFQRGLEKLGVDWAPALVVSSLELIETCVAEGFGIGATIVVPGISAPAGLRWLPLPGFDPVPVGVLWSGDPFPLVKTLTAEFQKYARGLE